MSTSIASGSKSSIKSFRRSFLHRHQFHADQLQGNLDQLEVLNAKGDVHDLDETVRFGGGAGKCLPPARQQKPDDVTDPAKRPRAEIQSAGEFTATLGHIAKRSQ